MKTKGIIFTIMSALLFGITPSIASYSYSLGSNAETLTFYRNLMVVPITLIIMLVKKTSFVIDTRQFFNIATIGILGKGITTLTIYASYAYIGTSVATTIHFMYPIFVALSCFIFFKEKISKEKIIALTLASIGIVLFLETEGQSSTKGVVLALISAVAYSVYMVGIDKSGLKNMDPFKLSCYMAISIAAAMFVYNLKVHKIIFMLPPKALGATFIVAISTSLFAVTFLQLGIKYLSATMAAIFSLFEPVTGTIIGVTFLGEELSFKKILGSAIILFAVAYMSLGGIKNKKAKNDQEVLTFDENVV